MEIRRCTICGVEKSIDQFGTYVRHKGKGKLNMTIYIRYQCLNCTHKRNHEWKIKNGRIKNIIPPQPEIEEIEAQTVVVIETKFCSGCKTELPLSYFSRMGTFYCKNCVRKHNRIYRERTRLKGGTRRDRGENGFGQVAASKPNTYETDLAKQETFKFMILLGWKFHEETGIWTKEGFPKDMYGNWTLKPRKHDKNSKMVTK